LVIAFCLIILNEQHCYLTLETYISMSSVAEGFVL
jgi:hypothetical protein